MGEEDAQLPNRHSVAARFVRLSGNVHKNVLAAYAKESFDRNVHCDLSFQCRTDDPPVLCHRIILAAAIPFWQRALPALALDIDVAQIYLPGFNLEEVRIFVESIYQALADNALSVTVSNEMAEAFQLVVEEEHSDNCPSNFSSGAIDKPNDCPRVNLKRVLLPDDLHCATKRALLNGPDSQNVITMTFLDNDDDHEDSLSAKAVSEVVDIRSVLRNREHFSEVPCKAVDDQGALLRMVDESYFCMIGALTNPGKGHCRLRPIIVHEDCVRPDDFDYFVDCAQKCYGLTTHDIFFLTPGLFVNVFGDDVPHDYWATNMREKMAAMPEEDVIKLKRTTREKYVRLKNDSWKNVPKKMLHTFGGRGLDGARQTLLVDYDLALKNVHCLALLFWRVKSGPIKSRECAYIPFPILEGEKTKMGSNFLEVLFRMWQVRPHWLVEKCASFQKIFGAFEALSDVMDRCEICGKSFKNKREKFNHMKRHRLEGKECCGIRFDRMKDLDEHNKLTHSIFRDRYAFCTYCNMLVNKVNMDKHYENCLLKPIESICPVCGAPCRNRKEINRHLKSIHAKKTCEICSKEMVGLNTYKNHKKLNHSGVWQCPHCGKVNSCEERLKYHIIRTHTRHEDKPFLCGAKSCNKGFHLPSLLREHVEYYHEDKTRYRCSAQGCEKKFSCASNMSKHKKNKHPDLVRL
jgi:hypothetical protein